MENPAGKPPVEKPLGVMPVAARLNVEGWEVEAPVPVIVSQYMASAAVPAAAVPALIVSVELAPAVTDVGLNEAEAPLGKPETVRLTVCALPDVTAVEIVLVSEAPCAMLKLAGLAEIEKSSVTAPPQPGNLNVPTRVLQLNS